MKVLIANRGEIAIRVIRACHEMDASAVAVYSECDRDAPHVAAADEAYHIGPGPATDSYLRADRIVEVARRSGATFVHPGYGFLAENADFAALCQAAGLGFIGPRPEVIRAMGGKTTARAIARAAGVAVVPGSEAAYETSVPVGTIADAADAIGFPLVVKAVAGGGGKGMRTVQSHDGLAAAIRIARSEAQAAFGDGSIYLERRLTEPRHVEIQVLADEHGRVIPFVERECSIQRRHQKVVEESPSPVLKATTRRAMADAAARIAQQVRYTNAGTIEFLVAPDGSFYFLEMNTRLQVEHPVTEAVTGIDLVQWQIRIARGEPLDIDAEQAMTPRGHAIECRIYAEDADQGFMPSPGVVREVTVPGGPFVRDDRGVAAGFEIPLFYDPLIAKLTVWGGSRGEAIARLGRALDEYRVVGVRTTLPFFRWLIRQPEFREGRFSTSSLDEILRTRTEPFQETSAVDEKDAAVAVALDAWFARGASGPQSASPRGEWARASRRESLR